jgi:hypothetical protein
MAVAKWVVGMIDTLVRYYPFIYLLYISRRRVSWVELASVLVRPKTSASVAPLHNARVVGLNYNQVLTCPIPML